VNRAQLQPQTLFSTHTLEALLRKAFAAMEKFGSEVVVLFFFFKN
jgi:hypothetical protein